MLKPAIPTKRDLILASLVGLITAGCKGDLTLQNANISLTNKELLARLYEHPNAEGKLKRPLFPSDWFYAIAWTRLGWIDGKDLRLVPRWRIRRKINEFQYWVFPVEAMHTLMHLSPEDSLPNVGLAFDFFLPDFAPYNASNYLSEDQRPKLVSVDVEPIDPECLRANPAACGVAETSFNNLKGLMTGESIVIEGIPMTTRSKRSAGISGQYYAIFESVSGASAFLDYWDIPDTPAQYSRNQSMKFTYYTPKYGGAKVTVLMHSTMLSALKKVDVEVWRKINEYIISEIK